MGTIKRFEEIEAWQTARRLTKLIYEKSSKGDFSKDYGLKDQIRRASVSVMSNIAEGFESDTQALFISYLGRAKASAGEVRSQLYIAFDMHYLSEEEFILLKQLIEKCSRQIYGLMRYLKSQPNSRRLKEEAAFYTLIG